MQEALPDIFTEATTRLGFKSLETVLDLTLYEYRLMLKGRQRVDKENWELQFNVLKRAINDVLSGKNSHLFKQESEVMSKDENNTKFQSLLDKFNKDRG